MSAASTVEPQEKMRARDVNRVARGEQAPRPPQHSPPVSRAPPPSSTTTKVETETNRSLQLKKDNSSNQMRLCYDSYHDYHKCIQEKGKDAQECKKVQEYYKSMCPEWIEKWRIE